MTQNCNCHGSGGHLSQTVTAVLERPRFSPGLILEDGDLTAAVDYAREFNRLLFRNLFGCGVVCGLIVTVSERCGLTVTVNAGLALDGCGDPIQLPKPAVIMINDNMAEEWKRQSAKQQFWVILCGKEKYCRPRSIVCESDEFDGVAQPTRIRALSEVSIIQTKEGELPCVCGCLPRDQAGTDDRGKGQQAGRRPGAERRDECQTEHEDRDECAEDCGCGTACACGCCVLLAKIEFDQGQWTATHEGVRRLIRPKLIPDHEPKPASWSRGPAIASDAESGAMMSRAAVIERIQTHLGHHKVAPETITLADLGLAPIKATKASGKTK